MEPLTQTYVSTVKIMPSAWHVFAIASIAIFMVSLDTTVLYAGLIIFCEVSQLLQQ
jgi:hypothetical protein